MCGRFGQDVTAAELTALLALAHAARDSLYRFNIAPMQPVTIAVSDGSSPPDSQRASGAQLVRARWGLTPSWATTDTRAPKAINARSETVETLPLFRDAFAQRRCLVPASGWYEWTGLKGAKQPHWITPEDGAPVTFAGLWDRWGGVGSKPSLSFTVLTADAQPELRHIHERMPVLIPPGARAAWLGGPMNTNRLNGMIKTGNRVRFATRMVDPKMNSIRLEGPECLAPRAQLGFGF